MGETSKYHRGDILLDPEAQLMPAVKVNLLPWQTYAILDSFSKHFLCITE